MTNPGWYESSSIWQCEFTLPRVLGSVCSAVSVRVFCATIRLLTVGRKCHSWHRVHTGLGDVLEVHGDVPEKKAQSTVGTLEDGLNTG